MNRFQRTISGCLAASLAVLLLGGGGCELDSADSVVRETIIVQGFYTNPDGGPVVGRNSGASIKSLDIRQAGDRLEAIDNNNQVFRGTIGHATDNTASYTLDGYTTAGKLGTMSGYFEVSGSSATMRGTWIEDDFYSTVYATATVPTNGGGGGASLKISPTSATLTTNNQQQVFTASGGSGVYTWSLQNNTGTISPTTGSTVTYTRTGSGNNTITVTDKQNQSASATISQP